MTVIIGTSGWQYRDWRGRFYPPELPQRLWLEHYAAVLRHGREQQRLLPAARARRPSRSGATRTPPDFRWAVKASRFLTHIKRLRDPEEPVGRLMERAAGLGDRLDPILLQLPPTLKADADLLQRVPGPVPGRHPGRRRAAARELVDRRDPRAARAVRRRAVLGRPRRAAGRAAVAHRRLGLPAAAHHGAEGWALPAGDAAALGRPAGRTAYGDGRRARLLQQRPRRRGDRRRRHLRRAPSAGPAGTPTRVPTADQATGVGLAAEAAAEDAVRGRRRPRRTGRRAARRPRPSTVWTARVSASGMTALSVRPARRHSVTSISSCA